MKTFEFKITTATGEDTYRIGARNLDGAMIVLLDIIKAPASAVKSWRVVPTARQIQKTKNLLRNI